SRSDTLQWCLITVTRRQRASCGGRQTRVKKVTQKSRIRLATWNVRTLISKSIKLVKLMKDRRVNITCLQEIRWKGSKAKRIDGYKLWYINKSNFRNDVAIIIDKDLKDKVVEIKRKSDRILAMKLVLGEEILNVVSTYAPQIRLEKNIKKIIL